MHDNVCSIGCSGAGLDYALAASAKQSADSAASSDDKGGKSKKGDGTKKSDKASPLGKRKKLCHLWFHTGYVRDCFLAFSRGVVDKASKVSPASSQSAWQLLPPPPASNAAGTGAGASLGRMQRNRYQSHSPLRA